MTMFSVDDKVRLFKPENPAVWGGDGTIRAINGLNFQVVFNAYDALVIGQFKATEFYKIAPPPAKATEEFMQARESLLEDLKPGSKVFVIQRHRSKSGNTRKLSFLLLNQHGTIPPWFSHPNHAVAVLLGYPWSQHDGHDTVTFKDRGYGDISQAVVGELSHILFGDSTLLKAEVL